MRAFLAVTNALSDENRVRTLAALHRHGELCVCQIVEFLGLAASTVSKHLALLHAAGLIDGRKDGRWMYYRIADRDVPEPARRAMRWAIDVLKEDDRILADDKLIQRICCDSPEDLCKRQSARKNGNSTCCSSAPATPAAARWPKASRVTSAAT